MHGQARSPGSRPLTPVAILVVSVALLAGGIAAYLLAPFESPEDLVIEGVEPVGAELTIPGPGEVTPQVQRIAAIGADGRLVVLDAVTGRPVNVVGATVPLPPSPGSSPPIAITVNEEVKIAYVAAPSERGGGSAITMIRLSDGSEEHVAAGSHPALRPGGDLLAFVGPGTEPTVHLHDIVTGDTEVLGAPSTGPELAFRSITGLAWSPTGGELLFTTADGSLWIVDPDEAHHLGAAERLGPDLGPPAPEWLQATSFDLDLVIRARPGGAPGAPISLLRAELHPFLVAAPLFGEQVVPPREVSWIDGDHGGDRLLLVAGPVGQPGRLWTWDGRGEVRPLADGVVVAAW